MDLGHKMTDEILSDMEKEITEIYASAKEDAQKKAETFFQKFEEKDKRLKAMVDSGQMSKEEYQQWRTNKYMVGARYKAMADGLAQDMTNANKIAASVINGHLPDVYATNYNWGTYKIEQDARIDTNFMIYDRQTVERLVREKPDLLPMKAKISVPEDLRWNKKQINGVITQGILTGASIPEMAKGLAGVADMNKVSATRNARTMTTSAENGGRIDSYQRATEMGIKLTQEWLATGDARTRDEHRQLNGQEVPVGKPFKVDGYEIKFPADPEAPPFLVYNCRCCLISNFKGFDHKKMDKYTAEKPMSYKQWEEQHKEKPKKTEQKPKKVLPTRPKTKEGWAYSTADGYKDKEKAIEGINQCVENAPENARLLWEKSAPDLQPTVKGKVDEAYFSHEDLRVHLNTKQSELGDIYHAPYEHHFHEYMHNIDYLNRDKQNGMYFSETWKNKDGKSLEDVIMEEWYKKLGTQRTAKQTASAALEYMDMRWHDLSEVKKFMAEGLEEWKEKNGKDAVYKELKSKLGKVKKYEDYQAFYKENADVMLTDAIKRRFGYEVEWTDVETYINKITDEYSLVERTCLSDMMERFVGQVKIYEDCPLGAGHGYGYAQEGHNLSIEAFAEIGDSSFANHKSLELIKRELPETYKTWEQMVDELLKRGGKK